MSFTTVSDLENFSFGYFQTGSQLRDHVYARSRCHFAENDARRDTIATAGALGERQAAVRRFVHAWLEGMPPLGGPLEAAVCGAVEGNGFTVEAVRYQSLPGFHVTASLYLPKNRPERCPAVLFLCGHSEAGRFYANYQRVCQFLAQAGLIVLAQDPVGQGERSSYYDAARGLFRVPRATRDHEQAGMQCQLTGAPIMRYFLYDAMRSIDYLQSRPEVDPDRIGVTGNSGGGTQTSILMMADPRLAAAAPGTFIMNRESYQQTGQAQDAEQIWPGFTSAGFDHEDILLSMAPKPVCVLAVKSDFFCIEGTRRSVERVRRFWELHGRADRLELVEDNATHGYTAPLARAAARFFAKHLLGREVDAEALCAEVFPEERLYATPTGQAGADFPDARFIFDFNVGLAREAKARRAALPAETRRERAAAWLKEKIFTNREACPANPRLIVERAPAGDLDCDIAFWWTQPGLLNLGYLLREPLAQGAAPRGVTLALWEGGTAELSRHWTWLRRETAKGRAVFVLNISGMGPLRPDPINRGAPFEHYGTFHKLADDLTWIGDSLAALRTYEVIKALEVLPLWPELDLADLRLRGHGRHGLYARLASLAEPRLAACQWDESFTYGERVDARHYDSYDLKSLMLPGVLEVFDLDEV